MERYAAISEPVEHLPERLNVIETGAYLSLRALYREYRSGGITRERARIEKREIIKAYEKGMILYHAMVFDAKQRGLLSPLLSEMNKSDCPRCREMAAVWDGRERERYIGVGWQLEESTEQP